MVLMDISTISAFPMQGEEILATAIAAALVLGWLLHRMLVSVRERRAVATLTETVARLEHQIDTAHRVSLDLAARHTQLTGEYQEAEWTIHSLKSDLEARDARIEKLSQNFNIDLPSVNKEMWSVDNDFSVGTI